MADDSKITMTLDLETGQFTTNVDGAISKLGSLGDAAKGSSSSFFEAAIGINQALELIGKALDLVKIGIDKMGEAIKDAAAHELDVQKLNQSLSNSGEYSEKASRQFQELAESISRTSNVSEGLVLQTATIAARYTHTTEETERLTKAALKLSAATGIDAQSAVLRLGLSLDGINVRLNRTIPGIGQLTEEQLKHGAAVDFVMNKYPGLDNTITTFDGRMKLLHNSFEQVMVQIGDMIVKSPVINKTIELLAEWFQRAADSLKTFVQSGSFEKMLHDTIALGESFVTYVIAPLEFIYNIGKITWDGLVFGIQAVLTAIVTLQNAILQNIIPPLEWVLEQAVKVIGIFNQKLADSITETMRGIKSTVLGTSQAITESMQVTTGKMGEDFHKAWEKGLDFSFSTALNKRLEEIDHFVAAATVKQSKFKIGANKAAGPEEAVSGTDMDLLKAQEEAKLRIIESGNYSVENAAKEHERIMLSFEDKRYKDAIKSFKDSEAFKRGDYTKIESLEVQHQQNLQKIQSQYTQVSTRNFELGWQGAMANMAKQFTNFAQITQTLATKTHSIVSNSFIQMAKSHKFSMDQILNQFLSMIGETMIQWGVFDMLASLWPPNPAGFATGVALVAAGSVLVGIGGGSEGGAPTPGGAGSDTSGGAIASPQQANQNQLNEKSAQIIIQGDYLNSTQTQQHLTDIIRQSSDVTDFAIVAQGKTF